MTIDELMQRIGELRTTGDEPVVFEPNNEEYQEVRHVFIDDGELVLSNCAAE